MLFCKMDVVCYMRVFTFYMAYILPYVHGSFDCVCSYSEETSVYSSPDITSSVLGYMYEFDCKPSAKISHPGWEVVQFQHQIGYLEASSQVQVQLCSGKASGVDMITTKKVTASIPVRSTTITQSGTTTSPSATAATVLSVTTDGSNSTSSSPSSTAATMSSVTSDGSKPSSFSTLSTEATISNIDSSSLVPFSSAATVPSIPHSVDLSSTSASLVSTVSSEPNTVQTTSSASNTISSTSFSFPFTSSFHTSTVASSSTSRSMASSSAPYTTYGVTLSYLTSSKSSEKPSSLLSTLLQTGTVQISTHSVSSTPSTQIASTESTLSSTSATSILMKTSPSTVPSTNVNTSPMSSLSTESLDTQTTSTLLQSQSTSVIPTRTTVSASRNQSTQLSSTSTLALTVNTSPESSLFTTTPSTTPTTPVMDRVDLCPYQYLAGDYNVGNHNYPHFRQYGAYCYELRMESRNWVQARDDCVARGGDLAVVDNTEIDNRIENVITTINNGADVWIGLRRDTTGSGYKWSDALENIDVNIRQCVIKTDINDVIEGCYQKTVGCSRDNLPGSYDKFVKAFEILQRTTDELFQCLRVELPAALRQDNPCGVTLKDLMSILLVNFASKRQPYIGSTMNDIEFDVVKAIMTNDAGLKKKKKFIWL